MTTAQLLLSLAATASTRSQVFGAEDSSVKTAKEMLECVERIVRHRESLKRALADAISTYRNDDKTVLVSAERQEAWMAALQAQADEELGDEQP